MAWFSKSTISPDLQRIRAKASFDVEKLTILLYDGKREVERKRLMCKRRYFFGKGYFDSEKLSLKLSLSKISLMSNLSYLIKMILLNSQLITQMIVGQQVIFLSLVVQSGNSAYSNLRTFSNLTLKLPFYVSSPTTFNDVLVFEPSYNLFSDHRVLGEIERLLDIPISLIGRPDIYEEGLRRCYVMTQILNKYPEWNNFDDRFTLSRLFIMPYSVPQHVI